MRRRLLLATAVLLLPAQAQAHKLKAFATAVGADVSGYAYFSPGGRAQEAEVSVTLPDGTIVAKLQTNDEGEFSFTAKQRADYRILVDGGDGHEATYTIHASELPVSLAGASAPTQAAAPAGDKASAAAAPTMATSVSPAEIRAMVEQGLAQQLRPLREQIDAWQEKVWLHDVLGGLGYIIGLAGLAYGFMESRQSRQRREEKSSGSLKEARR